MINIHYSISMAQQDATPYQALDITLANVISTNYFQVLHFLARVYFVVAGHF